MVFELPMVSWFLSKLGILTPEFMRKYRRHAIVAIFVLAALLTPGTDPVSQVLLAVPLMVLYEISIVVSAWARDVNRTQRAGIITVLRVPMQRNRCGS